MRKNAEMLVAIRTGYTEDWDGSLTEIIAGQTRIAPEILDERPQYGEFFERGFSAPDTDAEQVRCRTVLPDGTVLADERFLGPRTSNARASWRALSRAGLLGGVTRRGVSLVRHGFGV
jgi:hypothetical protein